MNYIVQYREDVANGQASKPSRARRRANIRQGKSKRRQIVTASIVGLIVGSFWLFIFIGSIGGIPRSPSLGIAIYLAVVTCPVLLLGYLHFVGLLVTFFAPFGNADIYGLITWAYGGAMKRLHRDPSNQTSSKPKGRDGSA